MSVKQLLDGKIRVKGGFHVENLSSSTQTVISAAGTAVPIIYPNNPVSINIERMTYDSNSHYIRYSIGDQPIVMDVSGQVLVSVVGGGPATVKLALFREVNGTGGYSLVTAADGVASVTANGQISFEYKGIVVAPNDHFKLYIANETSTASLIVNKATLMFNS